MEGMDFGVEVRRMVSHLEASNPDLTATSRVQRAWSKVASSEAVAHTDAVFVVPDTDASEVIVYVDSQIWATELNLQAELLRLRLNIELEEMLGTQHAVSEKPAAALFDYRGESIVKKLRFVPSKEKYSHRFEKNEQERLADDGLSATEPVALSEEEYRELSNLAAKIEDPELRAAAFEAAKKNMEFRKGVDQ